MAAKTDTMTNNEEFESLGLSSEILAAVKAKGFERPTAIQKLTIPKLLSEQNDIIAQSQTGTGKTAAYGLPILQKLNRGKGKPGALILVPTRELALQVMEELVSYNQGKKLAITAIYGGASMNEQLRRLSKGADIVTGTPGRILDHIRRGTLKLDSIKYLVLDEADEMLNMGFIDDVEEIMQHTGEEKQILLFSATMPSRIIELSRSYMHETEILKVESSGITADLTEQIYFEVRESDKFDALTRIIDITPEFYGIVFSRTKVGVDELTNKLLERGYAAEGLHGDVTQSQREKILKKFRNRHINILIATDVAARGIDVMNLTHVINYSLPQDSESYVHRIGRTGRAGNEGTAVTFISPSEMRQFGYLKRDIKTEIRKSNLPTGDDIVNAKKQRIKEEIERIIVEDGHKAYSGMARELLDSHYSEEILSALLRLSFRNDLEASNYPEIRTFSVDRKGTARIFIAIGRKDGYDVRKLVGLIKRECGLPDKHINDIKLSEDFSFVSVPYAEAERAVKKLNRIRNGGRPLAEIARTDKKSAPPAEDIKKESVKRTDSTPTRQKNTSKEFAEKKPKEKSVTEHNAPNRSTGKGKRIVNEPIEHENEFMLGYKGTNSGFDWSLFEKGGSKWDRPRTGKSKKRR